MQAWIILVALFFVSTPAVHGRDLAADVVQSRAVFAEAGAALQAEDYPAFVDKMLILDGLRPNHAEVIYFLATAYSLNAQPELAMAQLQRLADMGLSASPQEDERFEGLAENPAFATLIGQLASNRQKTPESQGQDLELSLNDFIPEGIAFHAPSDSWLLGSIYQSRILRIRDGVTSEFANRDDGLWSVFGMRIDATGKSLWVVTSATPNTYDPAPTDDGPSLGKAKLMRFDLASGEVLGQYPASGAEQHWLGDLTLGPDGTVYASDSRANIIFALAPGSDQLKPLAGPEGFSSLQGLDWHPGCDCLMVADYSIGVFRVNPVSGSSEWLGVPDNATLLGIDGLYVSGNDLVAIQNGTNPHRIVRIGLDSKLLQINSVEVLAAGLDHWREPTLGTLFGGRLHYIADSHWPDFEPDGSLIDKPRSGPRVLWLEL